MQYIGKSLTPLIVIIVVFIAGCSDDDSKESNLVDMPVDGTTDLEVDDTLDQQLDVDVVDTAGDTPDQSDTDASDPDTGDATDDGDASDSFVDLDVDSDAMDIVDMADGTDPFAGRPDGQCINSSDCPAGFCSDAPGGVCVGCGGDADCPGASECRVGTCIFTCQSEMDCPPGFECLGSGRCGIIACEEGVCPVSLYACGNTNPARCARASCSGGEQCPGSTSCIDGVCIEDRALP